MTAHENGLTEQAAGQDTGENEPGYRAKYRDPFYILLAVTLILVVAMNVLFRRRVFVSDVITVQDRILRYRLKSDLKKATVVVPGRPTPPTFKLTVGERQKIKRRIAFKVSTNSQGFRGSEFSKKPPAGTFRIVCMGDSITFGWGFAEKNSYPRVLEAYLNKHGRGNKRIEVINAGVPGYDLEQILLYLNKTIIPLKPDLVTICKLGDLKARNPFSKYDRQLTEIVELGRREGFKVAFICPPRSSFDLYPLTPRFRDTMEQTARRKDVTFADCMTLFEQAGKDRGLKLQVDGENQRLVFFTGGAGRVVYETLYKPESGSSNLVSPDIYTFMDTTEYAEDLFFDDGHPNAKGLRMMGEYLGKGLLEEKAVH